MADNRPSWDGPSARETSQWLVSSEDGQNLILPPYILPDLFPEYAKRSQEQNS